MANAINHCGANGNGPEQAKSDQQRDCDRQAHVPVAMKFGLAAVLFCALVVYLFGSSLRASADL